MVLMCDQDNTRDWDRYWKNSHKRLENCEKGIHILKFDQCPSHSYIFQPVELLYKPLADFQEEYLTEGVSLQTVYNMYDEQENERLRKNFLNFHTTFFKETQSISMFSMLLAHLLIEADLKGIERP
jgi:hypothetical protein